MSETKLLSPIITSCDFSSSSLFSVDVSSFFDNVFVNIPPMIYSPFSSPSIAEEDVLDTFVLKYAVSDVEIISCKGHYKV